MTGSQQDRIEAFRQDLEQMCESHGLKIVVSSKLTIGAFGADVPVGKVNLYDLETNKYIGRLIEEEEY